LKPIGKPVALATLVCGTLDVIYPTALTLMRGKDPAAMWRGVASGPFPGAGGWGTPGVLAGLVVHFTLMAIIVAAYMLAARARPALLDRPRLSGIAYGLITYAVMNLVVLPLRFGAPLPPPMLSIATQLTAHILLVGLPIAFIAARYLRPARTGAPA
jgi:hypothetical protein